MPTAATRAKSRDGMGRVCDQINVEIVERPDVANSSFYPNAGSSGRAAIAGAAE
jgi:hypothetical protein